MSSSRSRNRPPASRAARQPSIAERTCPRCRYPVGLGANRVTIVPLERFSNNLARFNKHGGERRPVTAISGIGYASRPDAPVLQKASPPMLMALSGPSRPPVAGGQPTRLVILLHGLGADGNDLIGLQQYWGRILLQPDQIVAVGAEAVQENDEAGWLPAGNRRAGRTGQGHQHRRTRFLQNGGIWARGIADPRYRCHRL